MFQRNKQDIMEIATKSCRWFIICSFSLPPSPIYIFIHSPILDGRTGNRGVFLFPGPVSDTNLFLRRVTVELYALSHALLKPPSWHASNHQNPSPGETKILSEGEWVTMRFQTTHIVWSSTLSKSLKLFYSSPLLHFYSAPPLHQSTSKHKYEWWSSKFVQQFNSSCSCLVSSRMQQTRQPEKRI